eukprot:CAMPEP_0172448272 /NCGR_PEP_ID=MMETSP1065-20121228/7317_1 /TAXON_ID=265537 /ORGANISM="Amphiprora paludosa, Strain CCMP125" /LENGTH=449 /DNA_ID=CAMNT_0013199715 /DNA_START=337 /DNA_END=1686 /DNA_ORIENTATION=+
MTSAGYFTIVGAALWMLAAYFCVTWGVQPEKLKENKHRPRHMYAHYPQASIYTRATTGVQYVVKGVGSLTGSRHSRDDSNSTASTSLKTSKTSSSTESQDNAIQTSSMSTASAVDPKYGAGENSATSNFADEPSNKVNANSMRVIGEDEEHEDSNVPDLGDSNVNHDRELDTNEIDEENIEPLEDKRGCMQKWCCDYRIAPRTRREKWYFWTLRMVLGFMILFYVFFNFMMIGSRIENTQAAKRPDTSKYFLTQEVCAYNPSDPFQPFITFDTKEEARLANMTIAHCGNCGQCSNPQDIVAYVETRKTIAKKSKACGPKVFFGTKSDVSDCLQSKIPFSRPCANCWTDNMVNTATKCLSTCMRTLFSGFMTDNNVPGAGDQGWMNQCLFCDERMSGPAFVTCSGTARRRLGIVSEIERNPEEQCKNMDITWDGVNWDDIGFDRSVWENE